jgi:hypothetical protein
MPDIYFDVDTAIAECPVNIMPLLDDTDFKTRETAVAYNAAGMDLVWNFVTSAGAFTQTAVTPTTSGNYDWTHQGDGMYTIEITASGGASINNDTEGYGWFTGVATGVLPWRGPIIGFRAAALNDALCDGGDVLDTSVTQWNGTNVATPTVAGVPEVDVTHWIGTAAATPTVAGVPEVDVTHWLGATPDALNTAEDLGLMVETTIATLASQTSFTLTAGSADNDAYNGRLIVVQDASTAAQKCVGNVLDYTGASKTVTLAADPAIFTIATGDTVRIFAVPAASSVAAADIRSAVGLASANLDTQLSGLDTKLDTIDNFLDTEAAAILAAVDTEVAAIKAVTDLLPDAGALTSLATQASVNTIDDFLDTEVAAIKAKTDSLTFTVAGQVDANVQSINDVTITGNGQSGTEFGV